jgi:hypothetical protein
MGTYSVGPRQNLGYYQPSLYHPSAYIKVLSLAGILSGHAASAVLTFVGLSFQGVGAVQATSLFINLCRMGPPIQLVHYLSGLPRGRLWAK